MGSRAAVGDTAPPFSLPSTDGEIALADVLRDGPVLLVFYPGDETRVCTRQLCDYRDNFDAFTGLGLRVLAINPQSEDSHASFAARHEFPFPLLSDAGGRVCAAYGALNLLGMAKRALVLVDRDGRVAWRRDDLPLFYQGADRLRAELEAALDPTPPTPP